MYLEQGEVERRSSCTRRSRRRCARATWSRSASSRRGPASASQELLDVIVQAAAQSDRRQPAAVRQGRGRDARSRSTPSPIRRKHVLAHVFKVCVDPVRRQARRVPRAPGHDHAGQQLFIGDSKQAVQARAPVPAAGQGAHRDRRGASPATSARSPRSKRSTSTPCCTTRTTRTTSTCSRSSSRTPMLRPGDRAQAPRRRAEALGQRCTSSRRKIRACASSTTPTPTRP